MDAITESLAKQVASLQKLNAELAATFAETLAGLTCCECGHKFAAAHTVGTGSMLRPV